MKRNDLILLVILLAAGLGWLFAARTLVSYKGDEAVITVDGKEYGRYPLSEDRVIEIGDSNEAEIASGTIRMTKADCPNGLCLKQSPISRSGESIVCVPNKVIITISASENAAVDTMAE